MLFISTPATAKKIDKSRLSELDSSTLVDLIKVLLHTTKNTFILQHIKFGKYVSSQNQMYIFLILQDYMSENQDLRKENGDLFSVRDMLLRDQELVCKENERLLRKLEEVNT